MTGQGDPFGGSPSIWVNYISFNKHWTLAKRKSRCLLDQRELLAKHWTRCRTCRRREGSSSRSLLSLDPAPKAVTARTVAGSTFRCTRQQQRQTGGSGGGWQIPGKTCERWTRWSSPETQRNISNPPKLIFHDLFNSLMGLSKNNALKIHRKLFACGL